MMKKKKKRSITLIEIIIVIALISLIGSALAINMRGSLDKGRAFKTEQHMKQLENILEMAIAEDGVEPATVAEQWKTYVSRSSFVKEDVVKDGWGAEFTVSYSGEHFVFQSTKYNEFKNKYDGKEKKGKIK